MALEHIFSMAETHRSRNSWLCNWWKTTPVLLFVDMANNKNYLVTTVLEELMWRNGTRSCWMETRAWFPALTITGKP